MSAEFDRALWMAQLYAAGARPGVITIGLALATQADEQGLAAPGIARLAEISRCSLGIAHQRVMRLEAMGLARRHGRRQVARHRSFIRYQLIIQEDG